MTIPVSSFHAAAMLLVLACLLASVSGECQNWCNNRGYCTSPVDGEQHCICDPGFTGEDCSLRMCPKAYNPIQKEVLPNRRAIRLSTGVLSGVLNGQFSFSFSGSAISLDANANTLGSAQCTAHFTQLGSAASVDCVREELDEATGTGEYIITFDEYPLLPHENNIFSHDGNPPVSAFKCNMTAAQGLGAVGPFCSITDVVNRDIPEYLECAGFGYCDEISGQCKCNLGFNGT